MVEWPFANVDCAVVESSSKNGHHDDTQHPLSLNLNLIYAANLYSPSPFSVATAAADATLQLYVCFCANLISLLYPYFSFFHVEKLEKKVSQMK